MSSSLSNSKERVLLVISNYKRPTNIPLCLKAWKDQSVVPYIVVVDNSPCPTDEQLPERYPNPIFEGADDVWRWTLNLGCPARFAPALCLYKHRYCIFADDDLIPGPRAIEHCLLVASSLGDRFSTLGQIGRLIDTHRPEGKRYVSGNCPTDPLSLRECDITCRCYMVQTRLLHHMLTFRRYLYDTIVTDDDSKLLDIHDDILMSLGLQWSTGHNSYVIPKAPNPEYHLIARNLDEGTSAVWKRPTHFVERNRMVDVCLMAGWSPLG